MTVGTPIWQFCRRALAFEQAECAEIGVSECRLGDRMSPRYPAALVVREGNRDGLTPDFACQIALRFPEDKLSA